MLKSYIIIKKKIQKNSHYYVAFAFHPERMISIEYLTTLTTNEKDLLRKHCELAGHMRRIRHLRTFLVNEIHDKRAVLKRKKYKINAELEKPYGKILFGGKKRINGFDTFPCAYQGTLDSLVFRDFRNTAIENLLLSADPTICLTRFYYDASFPIKEFQSAAKFDDSEWALNDPLLGNGQTGTPRFPLNPSGIKPQDDSVTPLIKGSSIDPVPPQPHSHSICSEEVVASSSELTVDDYGAARTVEELVADT